MDGNSAAVTVASGKLEATFRPDVGMLGTSLRYRGDELLVVPDLSSETLAGIPLLEPWANRLGKHRYQVAGVVVDLEGLPLRTDAQGLPIHGTMTWQRGWEVVRREPTSLTARFDFGCHKELLASFPFPHTLTKDITVDGDILSVETTLEATCDRPVPVSFGYHPYLRLPVASRCDLRLRLPQRRHLALDIQGLPTGAVRDEADEDEPLGDRSFDDLYELGDDRDLSLAGGGVRLTLGLDRGYTYAQVFAPAGSDYVCLEPMTAPVNALVDGTYTLLAPGDTYTARFSLRLESTLCGKPPR